MAGISTKAAGTLENKYKYNGIEQNSSFDINIYDAFYRTVDPQIGRFLEIDPVTSHTESPYVLVGNNPILNKDWLGNYFSWVTQSAQKRYDRMREDNNNRIMAHMKELANLDINSSDENVQNKINEIETLINMHSELNCQWNEMDASNIEFKVSDEKLGLGASGTTDFSSNAVNIRIGIDNGKNDITAHEFRHGYSYLNGEQMSGTMLKDMTDEVVAYNIGYLFLDRGTASSVAKGYYDVKWFKTNFIDKGNYDNLKGKDVSLTTNTLASTVIKYNPNARISFLLNINQMNANLSIKDAMKILNDHNKSNPLEFRFESLLNNK